ncbi:MAG: dynamin family protein [Gammaproteobacteria bacterium]|nr:dynamin family protein [Gammaproteobacteria bacterium]MCW8928280.1 dynamin family protein [Gammaproteobacteria bacterium]MCW8959113.1 dynamin family protein [Gammaproteobacteria bacterium]MCW8973319.1 dynamin family protein [Gammaproteobacteria bacterium]MCW8992517.1 dynamin family protein [Gammaproteobacteria bacterium]
MANKRFTEQMHAYGQWKEDLIAGINHYQKWLDANEMASAEDELRIYESISTLRSDTLTIAFVAEFARGKTELINAIFFSEYDRRLLPSEAGRTTMCPTELFYDNEHKQAYIRLLPIETRLKETSIAEYKDDPIHWSHIDLDLDNADNMAEAFREIVKTKRVPRQEAQKLGLYSEADSHLNRPDGSAPEEIDIPLWRHALISFPHPLLKQGLVILDTPGLNALGSEPELALNMLPKAQAVMFVLSADTGVTKSDLDMWVHNVKPMRQGKEKGTIVILNKADTLWDDLKTHEEIERTIADQCKKAAQTLDIHSNTVHPVSAQKGLLAKIRHDQELLKRSNILSLESILANEILPYQQEIVREHVQSDVGNMIKDSRDLLSSRFYSIKSQLEELHGLSGKNNEVIEHLMHKTREEQVAYHKNVESFNANKRLLSEQSRRLLGMLSLTELDKLVSRSRESMTETWTTHGLKAGMKTFFDGISAMLKEVDDYSERLNRLITTVYHKFQSEHGLQGIEPVLFEIDKYVREMDKLYDEAEAFRNSPVTVMTEQHYVVKKFFISLVSHARNVFFKAHRDAESWSKAVMSPLVKQIKEHKEQMDRRLENLRKINESRDTLESRMNELKRNGAVLKKQYAEINGILKVINRPLDTDPATVRPAARAS